MVMDWMILYAKTLTQQLRSKLSKIKVCCTLTKILQPMLPYFVKTRNRKTFTLVDLAEMIQRLACCV